jgi:hypothetical protein
LSCFEEGLLFAGELLADYCLTFFAGQAIISAVSLDHFSRRSSSCA